MRLVQLPPVSVTVSTMVPDNGVVIAIPRSAPSRRPWINRRMPSLGKMPNDIGSGV